MNKVIQIISWITITLAIGVISVISYWMIYPYKTVEFYNGTFPIENENSTVERGGRLRYRVNACKFTDQAPEITKFFIDGVVYETPKSPGGIEKGCGITITDVYVPKAIPAGEYTLKILVEYHVNPIRTITFTNYTEPFIVE